MPLDYRKQYTSEQLEPLWPNAIIRGAVASLCTLAVLTVLAVLPVILDYWGLGTWLEESEPANPRVTPIHIRPEWYFLANYQWLKLFPSEFLGVSGRTMGVLSQGVFLLAIALLPFWARRRAHHPPGLIYVCVVTLVIGVFVALLLWAAWPPTPLLAITVGATLVLFYLLVGGERRRIRRTLGRQWEWKR